LVGVRSTAWWRVGRELLYVAVFYYLYELIRGSVVQSGTLATRHALWLVDLEQSLGLFQERWIQSIFLHSHGLIQVFNLYYGATHFLVPVAVLIWLGARHPVQYVRARNLLMVTTAIAFLCFWLYPVAPPRLLPVQFGFVDTIRNLGGTQVQRTMMDRAGNAYAALPSLHMAWAVWVTIAIYPLLRHRWSKVVAIVYPILTGVVVVATGNHFIADAIAGTALVLAVAWALDRLPAMWSARSPAPDGERVVIVSDDGPAIDLRGLARRSEEIERLPSRPEH
jgi:hypothetical protein